MAMAKSRRMIWFGMILRNYLYSKEDLISGQPSRRFDLTILFQGAAGASAICKCGNPETLVTSYWIFTKTVRTVENPSSVYPRLANRNDQYFSTGNTYWLRSSDYIRLKNFEIGYNVPANLLGKIGLKNCRIYAEWLELIYLG
jgi:hypothetical protein